MNTTTKSPDSIYTIAGFNDRLTNSENRNPIFFEAMLDRGIIINVKCIS